jgi:hypothetical protein
MNHLKVVSMAVFSNDFVEGESQYMVGALANATRFNDSEFLPGFVLWVYHDVFVEAGQAWEALRSLRSDRGACLSH